MTNPKYIIDYLEEIRTTASRVESTERSFYPHLRELLKNYFSHSNYEIQIEISTSGGSPDFIIYTSNNIPIIKFEAKDFRNINIEDLLKNPGDSEEAKHLREQCYKYRSKDIIVVITDFLKFWVIDPLSPNLDPGITGYNQVEILYSFEICTWNGTNGRSVKALTSINKTLSAMVDYLKLHSVESIQNAEQLRTILVQIVKTDPTNSMSNLHDEIERVINNPQNSDEEAFQKFLNELKEDFNRSLFRGTLGDEDLHFIDLYVQLVIFSTFIGWIKHNEGNKSTEEFDINNLERLLPSNGLIQRIVRLYIIPGKIYNSLIKLIELAFKKANYAQVMEDLDDLYGIFYSEFLKDYDPVVAKKKGVEYTPKEAIRFIIKSIDFFLKQKFSEAEGILSHKIKYLDPAAGTMGFASMLISITKERLIEMLRNDPLYQGEPPERIESQAKQDFEDWLFWKEKFLKNVFAFEILMAPYVLGYIRMLIDAEKLGANIDYSHDKPQIFLTNTLMDLPKEVKELNNQIAAIGDIGVSNQDIKRNIEKSLKIRHNKDIWVVMGNPPYSVSSQNETNWINDKVEEYNDKTVMKREEGKPIVKTKSGLRSTKDDYFKFIRFGQWRIAENSKGGIVAYLTNNYYIDGLASRGLRKKLRYAFDEIWILDLHGNKNKDIPKRILEKQINKDENIFKNVGVGIAVLFLIRYKEDKHLKHKKKNKYNCKVKYAERWGQRKDATIDGTIRMGKLNFLKNIDIEKIKFKDVGERLDHEFKPADYDPSENYYKFAYLVAIFKKNITGVDTGHDFLVSNVDKDRLEVIIENFYNGIYEFEEEPHTYKINSGTRNGKKFKKEDVSYRDGRDFSIEEARKGDVNDNIQKAKNSIVRLSYRGFDKRYLVYTKKILKRGTNRYGLMKTLLPDKQGNYNNLTLIVNRQMGKVSRDLSTFFVSNSIVECKCLEGASGLACTIFPLRLYNSKIEDMKEEKKKSNINPKFLDLLPYKEEITDDDVFYYVYGVLYSLKYRRTYRELISGEFPYIPFPNEFTILKRMAKLGKKLVEYHTLESDGLRLSDCPINDAKNDDEHRRVRSVVYDPSTERIYFDKFDEENPNETFWIGGITKEIWKFELGGYKQLRKWLYNRRYTDPSTPKKYHITHSLRHIETEMIYLRKMVSAIKKTLQLQKSSDQQVKAPLDEIYEEIETNFLEFDLRKLNILIKEGNVRKESQKLIGDF